MLLERDDVEPISGGEEGMTGRRILFSIAMLVVGVTLGFSLVPVAYVHAAVATQHTCVVTAPAGTFVSILCKAPGTTTCIVGPSHPLTLNATSSTGNAIGNAVCDTTTAAVIATCGHYGPTPCIGSCPGTLETCQGGVTIPPPFKGVFGLCVAIAIVSTSPVTATCTIFWK